MFNSHCSDNSFTFTKSINHQTCGNRQYLANFAIHFFIWLTPAINRNIVFFVHSSHPVWMWTVIHDYSIDFNLLVYPREVEFFFSIFNLYEISSTMDRQLHVIQCKTLSIFLLLLVESLQGMNQTEKLCKKRLCSIYLCASIRF